MNKSIFTILFLCLCTLLAIGQSKPPTGTLGHTAFTIGNKAYVVGSFMETSGPRTRDVFVFDGTSQTWSKTTPFPGNINFSSSRGLTSLGKGYVFTYLNEGSGGQRKTEMWQFNPIDATWTPKPLPQYVASCFVSSDSLIYIMETFVTGTPTYELKYFDGNNWLTSSKLTSAQIVNNKLAGDLGYTSDLNFSGSGSQITPYLIGKTVYFARGGYVGAWNTETGAASISATFDGLGRPISKFNLGTYLFVLGGTIYALEEGNTQNVWAYGGAEWVKETTPFKKGKDFGCGFVLDSVGYYSSMAIYPPDPFRFGTYNLSSPSPVVYSFKDRAWNCNIGKPVNGFDLKETNSSITISNQSVSSYFPRLQWSLNDTVRGGFTNVVNPVFKDQVRGAYKICEINYNECSEVIDTLCKTVQVGVCSPAASLCADYTYAIKGKTVGFINLSRGATSYRWDFGNTASSIEESPTYEYPVAGSYIVRLIATSVSSQNDTLFLRVNVKALDRVSPDRGGTGSYVTVTIEGYGFDANSRISLRSATGQIISPETVTTNSVSKATAIFNFSAAVQVGLYDVIASLGTVSDTLKTYFELQPSESPLFNVSLVGPGRFRTGVKRIFSIVVKNLSNTDAFMVPLYLTGIPKIADVKLLTPVSYELPTQLATDPNVIELLASPNIEILKNPIKYDSLEGKKYAFLLLPFIQAESTVNVDFELTVPVVQTSNGNIDFTLNYETFPPIFSNTTGLFANSNARQANTVQLRNSECNRMEVLLNCGELLTDLLIPIPSDCKIEIVQLLTKPRSADYKVKDASLDLGAVTAKCIKTLKSTQKIIELTKKIADSYSLLGKGIKSRKCLLSMGECVLDGLEDTDHDGFDDLTDKCPTVFGKAYQLNSRGCPDKDGDGYGDMQDNCPFAYSLYSNGCPSVEDDKRKKRSPPPSPKREGKHGMSAGNSVDPNAKYVSGWGPENISKSRNLTYTITFENLALAAFAAQKVLVTDILDKTKLNVATFRFLSYGFDKSSFVVDEHQQFFQIIDLRPAIPAKLAVKGFLDEAAGTVKWEFTTIDPITLKETTNDLVGFLPPNQTSPQGEGFVSFSIDVMPSFTTGDIVKNQSNIFFDNNPVIATNEVSAKIDEVSPQSQMSLVSIASNKDSATLSVAGTDVISGIDSYDIFRSVNDSTYKFIETTNKLNLKYAVQRGKKYKYYSIATDNVGNRELPPSNADVTFTIEAIVYDCPALSKNFGDACDDGNIATIDDKITISCECKGIPKPKDCPTLNKNIGDVCDDGNVNTIDDKVQADCTCKGTIKPKDCSTLNANIGDVCNDNNPNTNDDKVQSDCTCKGTLIPTSITINCPINISITISGNKTSAVVNYNAPTASSTCTIGTVKVMPAATNPASGSAFPIGTKTLSFTATDGCGNTSTCTFNVIVISTNTCLTDTEKPVFKKCPSSISLTTSKTCAEAEWDKPIVTDNCCDPSVSLATAPSVGLKNESCFPIGVTTVIYTATDLKGNKATCSFTVTITKKAEDPCAKDSERPVFKNCPTTINLTATSDCATANWVAPTATDNCGTPSVSSNYESGVCFPTGMTTVKYKAEDKKGNKAICSFTITVTKTCATILDPNKCYKIVNKNSGKLLDVFEAKTGNNVPIIQYAYNGGSNQKWQFTTTSNGFVKIKARHSNKYAACNEDNVNAPVYQSDYSEGGTKDWKLECTDNGYYRIMHKKSGKYLSTKDNSQLDKAEVVIKNWNNSDAQKWKIEEVVCSSTNNLVGKAVFVTQGRPVLNSIRLDWVENTAKSGEVFTIEKLINNAFQRLDIVKNTEGVGLRSYIFYDNNPAEGLNVYKINLLKNDGTVNQSPIIEVEMDKVVFAKVYPNPTDSYIDILFNNPSEERTTIKLFNILGVEVKKQTYEGISSALHVELEELPSGLYQLHVAQKGKRDFIKQIVIQR